MKRSRGSTILNFTPWRSSMGFQVAYCSGNSPLAVITSSPGFHLRKWATAATPVLAPVVSAISSGFAPIIFEGDGRMGCSVQIGCVGSLEPLLLPVGCSLNCGHEVSFSVSALRAGKSSYRAVDESKRFLLRCAGTLAKSIHLRYKGSPVAFAQTGLSADACERRAISRILNRDVLSPVPPLLAASHIKRSEFLRRHQHASRISSQENSRASKTAPFDWPPCNL